MARFYCPLPLVSGQVVDLPPTAARHVQVLRMQPGDALTPRQIGLLAASGEARVDVYPRPTVAVFSFEPAPGPATR